MVSGVGCVERKRTCRVNPVEPERRRTMLRRRVEPGASSLWLKHFDAPEIFRSIHPTKDSLTGFMYVFNLLVPLPRPKQLVYTSLLAVVSVAAQPNACALRAKGGCLPFKE